METSVACIGVDFSGARLARDQRKKIVALAAVRGDSGAYRIAPEGFNARVIASPAVPGWTAEELAAWLGAAATPRVVGFDFPFSLPRPLLDDPAFAARVGRAEAFGTWESFNRFVAATLPLRPPLDFAPFVGWRDTAYWQKRATDRAARAQPPLKSVMPVLFNMTLLGNALLASLAATGRYRIVPFGPGGAAGEVIEIYPGVTMRALGFPRYKRDPIGAIDTLLSHCADCGVTIALDPGIRHFCETYTTGSARAGDPDGSDALIALLTTILYHEGHAQEIIPPDAVHLRPIEGAVWGLRTPTTTRVVNE